MSVIITLFTFILKVYRIKSLVSYWFNHAQDQGHSQKLFPKGEFNRFVCMFMRAFVCVHIQTHANKQYRGDRLPRLGHYSGCVNTALREQSIILASEDNTYCFSLLQSPCDWLYHFGSDSKFSVFFSFIMMCLKSQLMFSFTYFSSQQKSRFPYVLMSIALPLYTVFRESYKR